MKNDGMIKIIEYLCALTLGFYFVHLKFLFLPCQSDPTSPKERNRKQDEEKEKDTQSKAEDRYPR